MTVIEQAPADSPQAAYERALTSGFVADAAQQRAVLALQHCHVALQRGEQPAGVYLWGPVGRGKTWLMDSFYNSLRVPARRQHFHHFMQWVHRRQFQLTGNADPLRLLAEELGREVRVLCFDELFVSDIGDAMLLGRLLSLVVEQGVVLVTTSNQPPERLYEGGYNRERFLPAIAALEQHMQVVAVDGDEDHRLHPGVIAQRYWVRQPQALAEAFARLSAGQEVAQGPLQLTHRCIATLGHSPALLWCRFSELCEQPLAATDFIELCQGHTAIFLSEVPRLGGPPREGALPGVPRTAPSASTPATGNCRHWRATTMRYGVSSPWSTSATTAAWRCTSMPRWRWMSCTPRATSTSRSSAPAAGCMKCSCSASAADQPARYCSVDSTWA